MRKMFLAAFALLLGMLAFPAFASAADRTISDFESGLSGWNNGSSVPGFNSSGAMRLHNSAYGSVGSTKTVNNKILSGFSVLEMDINLNGNTILGNDASAVVFDQAGWKYTSLKNYVANGQNGWQHVKIPLSDFTGLNINQGIASMTIRFWNDRDGNYDIDNIKVSNDTTTPPIDPPVIPPTDSNVIANFNNSLNGFDRGINTNGTMQLQNQANSDASSKKIINSAILKGYKSIEFDINLNGAFLLDGDAAIISFDQGGTRMITLKNRVNNGVSGFQHAIIELSEFPGLNPNDGVASVSFRFWNYAPCTYNIDNIVLTGNTAPPPIDPPIIPPTEPITNWSVKSIDSQVMSKYWAVSDQNQIASLVRANKSLGAKQIAVSINYNNYNLLKTWADIIHNEGLNVWFRGHWDEWDSWEKPEIKNGIKSGDYLQKTKQFILAHPELFRAGDAFTMCVESENAAWWTGIDNGPFAGWEDWRSFTRNQVIMANDAFNQIGLGGKIKTNWINMNGWVAWEALDQNTANVLGQITLDHIIDWTDDTNTYVSSLFLGNSNGFKGYDDYYNKWHVPMMAGEWGYSTFNQNIDPVHQKELARAVFAEFAKRSYIVGVNYWIDVGHASRLFDSPNLLDYQKRPIADVVDEYFA